MGITLIQQAKNTSRVAEYIKNQLKEDQRGEQLAISEVGPFTGSM